MSVASQWEASVKSNRGLLSIRASHISGLNALPMHHNDPCDRDLISQANAEGLTLTSDKTIAHTRPGHVGGDIPL
jgi:PIN domain nuclease of toxin-antitoxin system